MAIPESQMTTPTHHGSPHETHELKRELGLFSAIALVSGIMIGSGIFIVSADAARTLPAPGWLLMVWLFTAVVTIFGAMSYGKLALAYPEAGGQYVYLKKTWGELPAFLYGWALFFVIQSGTNAAVAVGFSKYLGVLVPQVSSEFILFSLGSFAFTMQKAVAVVVIFLLTLFNCRGVKEGALLQNVFTTLKIAALLGLIGLGLAFVNPAIDAASRFTFALSEPIQQSMMAAFAIALIGPLFAADAWNNVTFVGSEIKEPEKNLPKSMFFGVLLVMFLYFMANVAYLHMLPFNLLQNPAEDRVASAAMSQIFGASGAIIMAVVILISTFGCLNGLILAGARVYYAMAKDNLFFKSFGMVHANFRTPTISLLGQGVWSAVLALSGTYGQLLDYIMCTTLIFYVVTIIGLFKVARTEPEKMQMTKWVDYVIPVLYLVMVTYVTVTIAVFKPLNTLPGLGIVCLGIPIYYVWKALSRKPDPVYQ